MIAQDGATLARRGATPAKSASGPSARAMRVSMPAVPTPLPPPLSTCLRVLRTSSGVVSSAATAPAMPPDKKALEVVSCPSGSDALKRLPGPRLGSGLGSGLESGLESGLGLGVGAGGGLG